MKIKNIVYDNFKQSLKSYFLILLTVFIRVVQHNTTQTTAYIIYNISLLILLQLLACLHSHWLPLVSRKHPNQTG